MAENEILMPEENVFYKVFPGGTTDPETEMLIDTSGDTFSGSKEDAIRAFFQSQSGTTLMHDFMASAFVIFPDGEESELEQPNSDAISKKYDRILIYRIVPNSEDEIAKALIAGDPAKDLEVTLAMKEFREGVHSFMAEYIARCTEIEMPKGSNVTHLRRFTGECVSGESKIWPAKIDFRIKKPRSKADANIWDLRVF